MNMLYSLQDITLIPAVISNVNSRRECNPHDYFGMLPLFAAPMSSVIDNKNWKTFHDNKINTIIPRNIDLEIRLKLCYNQLTFVAFSLEEFEMHFCVKIPSRAYVLIDVANGHMRKILDLCKEAKNVNGDKLVIMAGNVANPQTYIDYAFAGIDYCRMSIGSGSQCTTANTGIYYPMGSLIIDTVKVKREYQNDKHYTDEEASELIKWPKIVADGGFNTFGDIIKALALGADYVMLGRVFAKCEEACGQMIDFPNYDEEETVSKYREYYGMSTKRAQKEFGKEGNKTEEGIASLIKIEYTLSDWTTRFTDYLRSAMSYTGHRSLDRFIGKVQFDILSPTAIRTFK